MRCEGEAAAGELLLTLVAFVQGRCGEAELKTARDEYSSFLEKSRALKAKLAAEGLFDASRKKPLPKVGLTIGVKS